VLLWLWGSIDVAGGDIEVDGDRSVVARSIGVAAAAASNEWSRQPAK
jgi:hypothetical protein